MGIFRFILQYVKNVKEKKMQNCHKLDTLSDVQMTDYIFDDLDPEQNKLVESYLLEDEQAYSFSLELILLVIKQGFSKIDLLAFLKSSKEKLKELS